MIRDRSYRGHERCHLSVERVDFGLLIYVVIDKGRDAHLQTGDVCHLHFILHFQVIDRIRLHSIFSLQIADFLCLLFNRHLLHSVLNLQIAYLPRLLAYLPRLLFDFHRLLIILLLQIGDHRLELADFHL